MQDNVNVQIYLPRSLMEALQAHYGEPTYTGALAAHLLANRGKPELYEPYEVPDRGSGSRRVPRHIQAKLVVEYETLRQQGVLHTEIQDHLIAKYQLPVKRSAVYQIYNKALGK